MDPNTLQTAKNLIHTLERIYLPEARERLKNLIDGDIIVRQGGAFGDHRFDTDIRADLVLGQFLAASILSDSKSRFFSNIGHITVESGMDRVTNQGDLWVTIDPLDGSLNYKCKGDTAGFPYTVCITVLAKKEDATFNDIVAGIVYDLRNGDLWVAMRQEDGTFETTINGNKAHMHRMDTVDLGTSIIIAEMYYVDNREIVARAFHDQKGWLRSPGSAAYEMASVASGQATAFICGTQKQHELGAGYALVKGAGGVAVDWDGVDLGPRPFTFKDQTPVILASTPSLAVELVIRLNRAIKDRG